ncbi:hypothetical protein ACWGI8_24415 [Streptomyces sp. NPDC054841]
MRAATRATGALLAGLALGTLTACSPTDDASVRYAEDYANHKPLHVVGYPSSGSLQITQELVWRLADDEAGELESLASSDASASDTKKTAANWTEAFHKGAQGRVTADFYDDGTDRQLVVLYFHDTKQIKPIMSDSTAWAVRTAGA